MHKLVDSSYKMADSKKTTNQTRPTKKQRETLNFIERFVAEHGYGPSYREIMSGCGYSSVATVALHVNNLINRGHLRKNGRSARSLELTGAAQGPTLSNESSSGVKPSEEKWLVKRIEDRFALVEQTAKPAPKEVDDLYVLVGALKVLGLDAAASSYLPRLSQLKKLI